MLLTEYWPSARTDARTEALAQGVPPSRVRVLPDGSALVLSYPGQTWARRRKVAQLVF